MDRSRKFDDVLDECLERILVEGGTIERCLNDYPEYADQLKPLLETAMAAKRATAIQPRPSFRDRARYDFGLLLGDTQQLKRRSLFNWQWRSAWVTVTAALLFLLIAGGGTILAAQGSMPDNPLYAVKLFTERVQLAFTFSSVGKAEVYAGLADKRVEEIVYLAGEENIGRIESTTQRLDTCLMQITALSLPDALAGEFWMTESISDGTVEGAVGDDADAEEDASPAPGDGDFDTDSDDMAEAEQVLSGQVKDGVAQDTGPRKQAGVWSTVVSYNYPARLQAVLDTATPEVRAALMPALYITQSSHNQAIQYLEQASE